jgi:hypothetical protein
MTTLDEDIQRAERAVMQRDRQLRDCIDDVTHHARNAARSGGRLALAGAGAAAASWLGWRLFKHVQDRPAARERQRQVEREATRRAAYRHGHGLPEAAAPAADGKHRSWQRWLRLGLLLVPFVAPARSPAVAMASAVQRGGSWPLRMIRAARAAGVTLDWLRADRSRDSRPGPRATASAPRSPGR